MEKIKRCLSISCQGRMRRKVVEDHAGAEWVWYGERGILRSLGFRLASEEAAGGSMSRYLQVSGFIGLHRV